LNHITILPYYSVNTKVAIRNELPFATDDVSPVSRLRRSPRRTQRPESTIELDTITAVQPSRQLTPLIAGTPETAMSSSQSTLNSPSASQLLSSTPTGGRSSTEELFKSGTVKKERRHERISRIMSKPKVVRQLEQIRTHRPYFLAAVTVVQVIMMIVLLVVNSNLTGSAIATDPFNYMIGPGAQVRAHHCIQI
jgi:hypothetical protein